MTAVPVPAQDPAQDPAVLPIGAGGRDAGRPNTGEPDAEDWIKRLNMTPSGVGGWFAPAMVSDEYIAGSALPPRFGGDHPFYSSNWYLLEAGEVL